MSKKIFIALMALCITASLAAQNKRNPLPFHTYFEYGSMKNSVTTPVKLDHHNYFCAGAKMHVWREDRPILLEIDMGYRKINFYTYDSAEVNHNNPFGMAELMLGPRVMISKTSPWYPTISILGGAFTNFKNDAGFDAVASIGAYYNFTPPGEKRNGISIEAIYRPVSIVVKGFDVPPSFGFRVGFFF